MAAISGRPSEVSAATLAPDVARSFIACEAAHSLCDGKLAAAVRSPDELVAARAALAIGRAGQADGIPVLAAAARDRRAPVRAMAIYGLGLLRASDIFDVAGLLQNDESGAVRVALLDAIERYDTDFNKGSVRSRATPKQSNVHANIALSVASVLLHDSDPLVRARAASALAPFADAPTGFTAERALVVSLQTERVERVRVHVMWTIFRKYAVQVPREVLTAALHDNNEEVRIEAVRALGRVKNGDAIAALQPMLHDSSWRVSEQAAESIRALRHQPPTDHLTAIDASVTLPRIPADPMAALKAMPRTSPAPGKPTAEEADVRLSIDPSTAAQMLGPAHGPHPRLRIVTTKGNVYVVLYPEWAPLSVANFLNLMNRGFLDDNRWFRIVPDFVVQTGERDDKNAPGPGYAIPAELNPVEQVSSIIAMGLDYDEKTATPLIDSAGSEYYITLSPQLHLNLPFSVFGRVEWGDAVLAHLIESDRVIRIERVPDAEL